MVLLRCLFYGIIICWINLYLQEKGIVMGLGVESKLGDSIVTTRLDHAVNWGRSYSLWPMVFGTACCGIEFMSVAGAKYDLSRFGAEVVRFSPRQADFVNSCRNYFI